MRPRATELEPSPSLTPPTPAQITHVLDGLEHKWSENALSIQDRLTQAVHSNDAASAQKWAIAGGISTEKVLLMKGRPTEILGHLHAHRHELGPMVGKLAQALGVGTAQIVEASVQPQVGTRAISDDAHSTSMGIGMGIGITPVSDLHSSIQK